MAKTKTIKSKAPREQACAAQHMGPWAVYPQWFAQAIAAVKSGTFKAEAPRDAEGGERLYTLGADGIARIAIIGQVTKGESSFGGASTVRARKAVRKAVNDDRVSAILLHIDSPGGTVAGTGDLAADVAEANKLKPVYTYFEDLGASAAYWIGSQARRIFANPTAEVGSIGTMTYVEDTSGAYEKAGIKVTLIATGKYKGQWIDGNPVSEDYIAAVREEIEDLNEHFLAGVMRGRKMSRERLMESADGRVFIASKAQALGLIDEVASLDVTMQAITKEVNRMNAEQFSTYAAEHPEAAEVKALFAKGHKAGVAEGTTQERARVSGVLEAYGLNDHMAGKSIAAGHDVETAKTVADAAKQARSEADAQIAAKDAEIARLKAVQGEQGALALAVSAEDAGDKKKDDTNAEAAGTPEAQAKTEWAGMTAEQREAWASEAVYVKARIRQLAR